MKKKVLLTVIALVTVTALLLAACAAPTPTPTPEPERVDILIGGSGPGGGAYALSCGIMTIINENIPGVRATAIGVGTSANFRLVLQNEMFMCCYRNAKSEAAYIGATEDYPEPQDQLRFCANGWGSWAFTTTLDSNIKTMDDLEGKRIAIGGPGTITPEIGEVLFRSVGLERDVDYEGILLDAHDANDAMIDGTVDVVFTTGGQTCPSVVEVDTIKTLYFIPCPEDKMDAIMAGLEEAGLKQSLGVIPKELYSGLTEDYRTFVGRLGWYGHKDADEEVMYKVIKALYENLEVLTMVHPAGSEFNVEDVKYGPKVPMHPGALRYYKEIGLLTEDPFKG